MRVRKQGPILGPQYKKFNLHVQHLIAVMVQTRLSRCHIGENSTVGRQKQLQTMNWVTV